MMDAAALAPLAPALAAAQNGTAADAWRAAQEFETVFLTELVKNMQAGLEATGEFSGGPSEDIYRGLMGDAIAQEVARAGGIGIAAQVYQELIKMQEAGHDAGSR